MAEVGDLLCSGRRSSAPVTLEMMEYSYIDKCERLDELRSILTELRSGKHGRFLELEKHCEAKVLKLLPRKERRVAEALRSAPSAAEAAEEETALREWASALTEQEARLVSEATYEPSPPAPRHAEKVAPHLVQSAKNEEKTLPPKKKEKKKISGYDFRAWEKYDVDKACEEIDEAHPKQKKTPMEEKRRETRLKKLDELSVELGVDSKSDVEKRVLAERERRKGNEEFRAGEIRNAYDSFSRSLAYLPSAVAYANRALAAVKLDLLETAEDDCAVAVDLDPNYLKAKARLGMTRLRRGKYAQAVADLQDVLDRIKSAENTSGLDPVSIAKLLDQAKAKLKDTSPANFTRVPVVECDDSDDDDDHQGAMVRVPVVLEDDDDDDDDHD